MQIQPGQSLQQEMLRQRLPFVIIGMVMVSLLLVTRVISFQFPQDPRVERDFASQRDAAAGKVERFEAPRGTIYDRNGNPLAVNTLQYRVYVSPNVISNKVEVASQLAAILNLDELDVYNSINVDTQYVLLATGVSAELWSEIRNLDIFGVAADRLQRRQYPQETVAAQILGFVAGDGEDASGYEGVEGYYQQQLAGLVRDQEVSNIPFNDLPEDFSGIGAGADLVLTIDRDVQFLIETELALAVESTQATGGTIIVMNPRNGDILAMASYPSFNPNEYYNVPEVDLRNPAVRDVYEPGSVFKVITVAAALEAGVITPNWTYNDQGSLDVGGIRVTNWDRGAYGLMDVTQVLVNSLNVGAGTIAMQMTKDEFYAALDKFGFGNPTRVDLQGEEAGILRTPNDPLWSESDLVTNSFGQGISVTPLQMLTSINAIANGGLMMEPRVVYQIIDGDTIITSNPTTSRRPISPETAAIVTQMMVTVVEQGLDGQARVPGYSVAGKTGTAQIADTAGIAYLDNVWNMTFVGFLPADDPQISVLVKLDRPRTANFASQTAAPVFSRVTSRLVALLEIPTDDVRLGLAAQGVRVGEP